jgi:cyclophilin family peptidyl-prolyl cis-trans isomerase
MRRIAVMAAAVALLACGAARGGTMVQIDVAGMGSFTIELYDSTPETRANFLQYADNHLYDGAIFHRSDHGNQVLQAGGFALSTPPYLLQYVDYLGTVAYEGDLGGSNVMGTVGMARGSDPASASNQWYINMGDNSPWFDDQPGVPGYTVFGEVVAGWDVLVAIYALKVYDASGYFGMADFARLPLMPSFNEIEPTYADFVSITATPEPATLALVALGGLAVLLRRRARR